MGETREGREEEREAEGERREGVKGKEGIPVCGAGAPHHRLYQKSLQQETFGPLLNLTIHWNLITRKKNSSAHMRPSASVNNYLFHSLCP